jgi:hypothetical protein
MCCSDFPVTVSVKDVDNIQQVADWVDVLAFQTVLTLQQPKPPIPRVRFHAWLPLLAPCRALYFCIPDANPLSCGRRSRLTPAPLLHETRRRASTGGGRLASQVAARDTRAATVGRASTSSRAAKMCGGERTEWAARPRHSALTRLPRSWASPSSTRTLAVRIVVGTIDACVAGWLDWPSSN